MIGFEKEIEEVRETKEEFTVLTKLLIASIIRQNAINKGKLDYDLEIEEVSKIFNKLQEKLNESKRSEKE